MAHRWGGQAFRTTQSDVGEPSGTAGVCNHTTEQEKDQAGKSTPEVFAGKSVW